MASALADCWAWTRSTYDQITVWGNRRPILQIRQVIWFFSGGLWLAILYCVGALAMATTLVFLPFSLQVFRISLFALDGGITLEPISDTTQLGYDTKPWHNPSHPYTIAANVFWAIIFGWAMVLAHVSAAMIQAATIVGIGTAVTNLKLASYVIWPFGRRIQRKALPTSLEELHQLRAAAELEASTQRTSRWWV